MDGISAVAIHGNKSQPQRVRALDAFKKNKVAILVATEVAARGLDIESLPHVVNYELPMVAADYVHRIGRTGRAGTDGDAISLVCVDERPLLADIERLLGHRIETEIIDGFAPDPSDPPAGHPVAHSRPPAAAPGSAGQSAVPRESAAALGSPATPPCGEPTERVVRTPRGPPRRTPVALRVTRGRIGECGGWLQSC